MSCEPRTQPAVLPTIAPELLEYFGSGPMTAETINAASLAFTKTLIERALIGEMNHHLGYLTDSAKPEAAQAELDAFAAAPWGQGFPTVSAAWRNAWDRVIPFFAFPPTVHKVIYTTNAIENINSQLRKIIKTRGHFLSDDAAAKLIWLALRNITAEWSRSAHDWKQAMNQFSIIYEERVTRPSV